MTIWYAANPLRSNSEFLELRTFGRQLTPLEGQLKMHTWIQKAKLRACVLSIYVKSIIQVTLLFFLAGKIKVNLCLVATFAGPNVPGRLPIQNYLNKRILSLAITSSAKLKLATY